MEVAIAVAAMVAALAARRVRMVRVRMLRAGPDVSLKGSPTVSPITHALWVSVPFFSLPSGPPSISMYFLSAVILKMMYCEGQERRC